MSAPDRSLAPVPDAPADLPDLEGAAAEGLASIAEAQDFLGGVSRAFLYSLMERGSVRYAKQGRRRMVLRADLRAYVAARVQGGVRS